MHIIQKGSQTADQLLLNLRELKAMQAQPDMEFSTRNLLSECWMLLMQELRETQPEDALPSAEGQERLRNMIAFIHTHYGEKLTLAQIAASAAVSEREALRCFRKYFHQSPFEYLNSFRLHQAKKMLIETNQENDFTSFRTNDMDIFVMDHSDSISQDKVDMLESALDKYDESFEKIKMPVTSVSFILYSGYRIVKDNKDFSKLVELIDEFLTGYDSNEKYKQYVQSGTSSSENVRGRLDWWRNKIKTL